MVYPHIRKIIHSLKFVDYLLVQADKQWYNYYLQVDGIPVGRTGKVGDRTIVYDTGTKTRVRGLTLWKRNRNGDYVADVIVYHK